MDEKLAFHLARFDGLIPVNYQKAKCVFKNKKTVKGNKLLKFVAMDKFQTKKGMVKPAPKFISRCITW